MRTFIAMIKTSSTWMNIVAEIVLVIMMMLTVFDVALRGVGKPIVGTYELVAMAGAVVIGFAVPRTSWERGHVFVDFLIENRSKAIKDGFFIATRIVGIIIYALLSWNLLLKGIVLQKAGEVSLTLQLPFYPPAFALSLCFCVQCFVLLADILRINETKEQALGEEI
jgi:TRAP-type C4-dicarboxylate transport system permease small subunit